MHEMVSALEASETWVVSREKRRRSESRRNRDLQAEEPPVLTQRSRGYTSAAVSSVESEINDRSAQRSNRSSADVPTGGAPPRSRSAALGRTGSPFREGGNPKKPKPKSAYVGSVDKQLKQQQQDFLNRRAALYQRPVPLSKTRPNKSLATRHPKYSAQTLLDPEVPCPPRRLSDPTQKHSLDESSRDFLRCSSAGSSTMFTRTASAEMAQRFCSALGLFTA